MFSWLKIERKKVLLKEIEVEDVVVSFCLTNMRSEQETFRGWARLFIPTGDILHGDGIDGAIGFLNQWRNDGFAIIGDEIYRWEDFKGAQIVSRGKRMQSFSPLGGLNAELSG